MDDSFSRLYDIYHAASDVPISDRQQFLAKECGDDLELQEEVLRLLARNDQSSDDPLGTPIDLLSLSPPFFDDKSGNDCTPGQRIGSYQIERVIGQGGSGTVALAVRKDEFSQRVAIKILRRELVSNQTFIRRFEMERQLLSDLQHENIAGLVDGGCTETGQPYLVMEYVNGDRITEYCDQIHLNINARLRLFQTVCQAVSHAHRFGVIHRDIKPSNIMVSSHGVPKLVDFGIAKLVERKTDVSFQTVTIDGELPMTPEYASPEQLKHEAIGTASDIYSLGIVLYEMLTGARPYDFTSRSLHEVVRVVCDEEPTAPSSALLSPSRRLRISEETTLPANEYDNRRRSAELRGDLDQIVLKAMRKEPELRYASVDEFSNDIDRYFTGLPVSARRGTMRYKAGKFLRRHTAIVLLVSALFVLLVGGLIGTSVLVARLIAERNQNRELLIEANLTTASRNIDQGRIDNGLRDLSSVATLIGREDPGFDVRFLLNKATHTNVDVPVIFGAGERFCSPPHVGGQRFATVTIADTSENAAVRIWDANHAWRQRAPLREFRHRELRYDRAVHFMPPVTSVACHPPTDRIIFFTDDWQTIKLFDMANGTTLEEYSVQKDKVSEPVLATISPNGSMYAVYYARGGFQVFDLAGDGIALKTSLHPENVAGYGLSFSPDSKRLATVNERGGIHVLNTEDMQLCFTVKLKKETPFSLSWSVDGSRLIVGTREGIIYQWDVTDRRRLHRWKLNQAPTSVAVSPDNRLLAVASRSLQFFELDQEKLVAEYNSPNPIIDTRFSFDGESVLSTDDLGVARRWPAPALSGDSTTKRFGLLTSMKGAVVEEIVAKGLSFTAVHPDGQHLAFKDENMIRIYDRIGGQEVGEPFLVDASGIWQVTFSRDGRMVSASDWLNVVTVFDFQTREKIICIPESRRFLFLDHSNRFAVQRGSELIIGNNSDLLSLGGKSELPAADTIVGSDEIHRYSVAETKPLVAVVEKTMMSVDIWNLTNQELIDRIVLADSKQAKPKVWCVFSPDASRLAIAYLNTLELWDVDRWKQVFVDRLAHGDEIRKPVFSPDSSLLVIAEPEGRIWFRDGKTGRHRLTMTVQTGASSVRFSSDGNSLIVGHEVVNIWNALAPKEYSRTLSQIREQLRQVDAAR